MSYKLRMWGNRRKADVSKIQTDTDKKRLNLTKRLIESKEYKDIIKFQGGIREYLSYRAVPSFFRDALMLVKTDMVNDIDAYLVEAQKEQARLVENLIKGYPMHIQTARIALNGMFREENYPSADRLTSLFGLEWNWIVLSVADNLPDVIRQQETTKLQNLWEESIGEIIKGLRVGFKELVDHAVDRLTVEPGEKPKIFKDSLVPNFKLFIETFNARNIVNDVELENLVTQAKSLLEGLSSDQLRTDTDLRKYTAAKFAELKKNVDAAVITAGRRFDFSDDDYDDANAA